MHNLGADFSYVVKQFMKNKNGILYNSFCALFGPYNKKGENVLI